MPVHYGSKSVDKEDDSRRDEPTNDVKLPTAGKISSQINESRNDRVPEVAQWNHVLRFLNNEQYYSYGVDRRSLVASRVSPGQNEVVTNLMLPIFRATISMLRTRLPRITVVPTTPSIDNITKAKASSVALHAWWSQAAMDDQLAEAVRWLSSCGTVALHTYYDSGTRKIVTECVNPYDLFFEPYTVTDKEWQWVAIRSTVPKAAAIRAFPECAEYIKQLAGNRDPNDQQGKQRREAENRIDVYRVYWKNGRVGVLIGSKWAWQGKMPQCILPVSIIRFHDIPTNIYGMAQLYPTIDIQRSYNRFKNFSLDIADTMSNPVWIVPSNSGISSQNLNNQPGAVVRYNSLGQPPRREPGISPPPGLFDIQGREHAVMFDVASMHAPTTGKRTTGVTSGVAIRELREGDIGALEFTMQDINRAVEKTCAHVLVLMKAHIPESEFVHAMDQSAGVVVYREIRDTDIVSSPEIRIEASSLFVTKAIEKDQQIEKWLQLQLMTPQEARKHLSMRISDKDSLQEMIDNSHAQDLLEYCKKGGRIHFSLADNVSAIKQVFEEYIRSPQYYAKVALLKQKYMMTQDDTDYVSLVGESATLDYIYDQYLYAVALELGYGNQDFQAQLQQAYRKNSTMPQAPQPPMGPQDPMQAQLAEQQGVRTQDIGNQQSMARQDMSALRGTPGITGSP